MTNQVQQALRMEGSPGERLTDGGELSAPQRRVVEVDAGVYNMRDRLRYADPAVGAAATTGAQVAYAEGINQTVVTPPRVAVPMSQEVQMHTAAQEFQQGVRSIDPAYANYIATDAAPQDIVGSTPVTQPQPEQLGY